MYYIRYYTITGYIYPTMIGYTTTTVSEVVTTIKISGLYTFIL